MYRGKRARKTRGSENNNQRNRRLRAHRLVIECAFFCALPIDLGSCLIGMDSVVLGFQKLVQLKHEFVECGGSFSSWILLQSHSFARALGKSLGNLVCTTVGRLSVRWRTQFGRFTPLHFA